MKNKFRSRKKELLILLFAIIFALATCEIAIRIFIPEKPVSKYGWFIYPNYTEELKIKDHGNITRNITIHYYENGFKRWGNLSTNKTKVLILGDSFTHM